MTTLDLKSLERRAFTSTFQDGIFEMYIGVLMLLTPITTLIEHAGLYNPGIGAAVRITLLFTACALFTLGKRYITVPRLGRAEFGKRRRSRKIKLWLIMAVSVSITALLFLLSLGAWNGWFSSFSSILDHPVYIGAFFAVKIFVLFSFIAYFMDFPRAFFIGMVLAAGIGIDIAFDHQAVLAAGGLLLLFVGLVYFTRFIGAYHIPRDTDTEGFNGRV